MTGYIYTQTALPPAAQGMQDTELVLFSQTKHLENFQALVVFIALIMKQNQSPWMPPLSYRVGPATEPAVGFPKRDTFRASQY